VSVKVGAGPRGTEAVYRLADGGLLTLRFRETEGTLVLGTFLRKMGNALFSVQPLLGRLEGASRFFRQGLGFSGPSGFVELGEQKGLWRPSGCRVVSEGPVVRSRAAAGAPYLP
jgi:hypothetical protein